MIVIIGIWCFAGARDTGLTEALKRTYVPGERPGFLKQQQQQYSSAAWNGIAGSIYTRRRQTASCCMLFNRLPCN